jgi:hypothetical protein
VKARYAHISYADRTVIRALKARKYSPAAVARTLGKHRSTVCRELKRNTNQAGIYFEGHANAFMLAGLALRFPMTPIMAEMAWRYPDLTIEVTCDDRLVDIVAEGFNAGIQLGEMIAEDMIGGAAHSPFQGDPGGFAFLSESQGRTALARRSVAS